MKVTLKRLLEATTTPPRRGALSAFAVLSTTENIPLKPAYWIAKVGRLIERELEDYDTARVRVCESLGTLKEGATEFDFTPEARKTLDEQVAELQKTEIDLIGIEPIKIDALGEATVPPGVLMTLDWLIVE